MKTTNSKKNAEVFFLSKMTLLVIDSVTHGKLWAEDSKGGTLKIKVYKPMGCVLGVGLGEQLFRGRSGVGFWDKLASVKLHYSENKIAQLWS